MSRRTVRSDLLFLICGAAMSAVCLLLFFMLRRWYGYLLIGWMAAGQLLSGLIPVKNRKLYVLFALLSFGFPFVVRAAFDLEKRSVMDRSIPMQILFFGSFLCPVVLFDIWMALSPIYVYVTLALNFLLSVILLCGKKDVDYKLSCIFLLFVFFGIGHILYILASLRLYFARYRRRVKKYRRELPPVQGGKADIVYIPRTEHFCADLIRRISAAKSYICMEFFLFDDGKLLRAIYALLLKKAKEGVQVYLIYDELGSFAETIGRYFLAPPENFHACPFNPLSPFFNIGFHPRDHRKIVLIDGQTSYIAGANIADEYINLVHPHGMWKDSALRIDGPAAQPFDLFCSQWYALTGERIDLGARPKGEISCYSDGPAAEGVGARETFLNMIDGARRRILIVSPYFIAGHGIRRALIRAAKRGVKVKIFLPGIPDKPYVHYVSRAEAESLMKHGIGIYYLDGYFLHSKLLIADNAACVGTANFDFRSFYTDCQCGIVTKETDFVRAVRSDIAWMEEHSTRMDEAGRLKHAFFPYTYALLMRLLCILY